MDGSFSEIGEPFWNYIQISTTFILTMLAFFAVKNRKYLWLRPFMLVMFTIECLFTVVFHEGLRLKLFAVLMLTSTMIVAITQRGKRVRSDLG
jgi:uncharacterized membrane protein YozB (DUF420 family)